MGRSEPTSQKPAHRKAEKPAAERPARNSAPRPTTRAPSKNELALAAAQSELHLLKRISLQAPTLTELITISSPHTRASVTGNLGAAVEQAETAWSSLQAIKTRNLRPEMRTAVDACRSEVKEIRLRMLDLAKRATGLKDGIAHCPAPAPLLTYELELDLTRAMASFRQEFWGKLSEIPLFQAERVSILRRVLAGTLTPQLSVFSNKSKDEPDKAILKRVKQALEVIDKARGKRDFFALPAKTRSVIAKVLLEVPASPHDCLQFFSQVAKDSATLSHLESKVLCRYASVAEAARAGDPDAQAVRLLQRNLGGNALQVHAAVSRITTLQAPYLAVKDYLVLCNTGLIHSIINRSPRLSKNKDDLVQEGVFGLMKGIEKYDPDSGFRLGTYVTFWVRQITDRMQHFINRVVMVPVHQVATLVKMHRALSEEAGQPDLRELARSNGLEEGEVFSLLPHVVGMRSMDHPSGEDKQSTFGSLIPDPRSPDIEREAGNGEMKALVQQALRHLPERLRAIITMRFGLDGNPPLTLNEVGDRMKLTRERIRQLEQKAFITLFKLSRRNKQFASLPFLSQSAG